MPTDGAGKHDLLQVAALLQQVVERVAVGDANHVLLDDGAVIENVGHVMAGSSDQLDSASECLVIRFRAHERGQKRVMNINDAVRVLVDELVGQDLHVASQNDEIQIMLFKQCEDFLFRFAFVGKAGPPGSGHISKLE